MPTAIGLTSSQQESFEHHEELSKLLNETDVFYVPFQSHFQHNQDLSDLTKRFDEDIFNKHLVVTFRDIGYSLFLDSVNSVPDQNDQTKTHISGKMIVDGICVQFLGCFDAGNKTPEHDDTQQINGVGRIQLDEDYYRELSSAQGIIDEKTIEPTLGHVEAITHTEKSTTKKKTRSQTISESIPGKTPNNIRLKSPPSSLSNSRSHPHSPSHMPYTTRSPRTINQANKYQFQTSSPININNSSASRNSGFHSSIISPSSSIASSFNENILDPHHQRNLTMYFDSSKISSSLHNPTTMPIQIPSSNNNILPASFSQFPGIFPSTQSHSLPNYFLPQTNFAYLITSPDQHQTPPFHIISPINHPLLKYPHAHFPSSNFQATLINENLISLQSKRMDSEENKQTQPMDTTKQSEEQLPFKKRRYTGQSSSVYSPMDINHDDDDASNESMKK